MTNKPHSIHIPERSVDHTIFSNGTTMLYAPNPYNRIVAVRICSRLASRNESREKAGMANLCLRLLSTGTEHSTEEEISERLERNGAHYKAEAGKDVSFIDLLTTVDFVRHDIDTIMETIEHPTFHADKIEREKEIARMNILEQDDSHLTYTVRNFRQHYYGHHAYGWPSIGLIDTLEDIGRDEDILPFAKAAFDPAQLVVTVVGGTHENGVAEIIRDAFGSRSARNAGPLAQPGPARMAVKSNEDMILHRESESEYIVMGYPGCGINDDAAIAMRLLSAILGGSMDSRLFREIRDKRGLCYQVGSSYSPQHELSPFLLYIVTSPENREEAVACAEAEINRLKEELVGDEELERVKTFMNGTYVMSMESNMGQVSRYAAYEMAGLGWNYINEFPGKINAVTPGQLRDIAREFFTHRLLTITASSA
jgi:zinc protease